MIFELKKQEIDVIAAGMSVSDMTARDAGYMTGMALAVLELACFAIKFLRYRSYARRANHAGHQANSRFFPMLLTFVLGETIGRKALALMPPPSA